jgi:hypothetical protein
MPAQSQLKYPDGDLVSLNVLVHRKHRRKIKMMACDLDIPIRDVIDRILVSSLGDPAAPAAERKPRPPVARPS